MSENILVPVLGESITEATVAKWLKKEGDNVEADEAIVELETDKVNLEVPSPINGILYKIKHTKDIKTVHIILTLIIPIPLAMPTVIAQNIKIISKGSLIAERKRTIESAPTIPKDKIKFPLITIITDEVIIDAIIKLTK